MAILACNRRKTSYPIKDPLDRVTSMTSPAGTTTYHYDTLTGRLDRITSPEGKEFNYTYSHGQLSTLAYPNGITANYAFDDNGNLTDLHYQKSGVTVKRYQYRYDKNGMRDTMIDNDGVHAYAYDALYQIVQATHPTVQNPLEQFTYDSVGNRLTDLTHSTYQYNELNQLLEDDSCTYAYDLDGNMTAKIDKNTGDTIVYTYDIENKLVQVQKTGMLAQYAYDAMGRRMAKTVNGAAKHYRYNGENLILEMNGQDSVMADYTFGPTIDDPLSMHRNGNNYFYVKDRLGSVTALADNNGNVVHEYKYGVFGKLITESGDSVENFFTYTGRELDRETGLLYYRHRFYDPQIGRFLQEDPFGFTADINFYRYCRNSPMDYADPMGLQFEECEILPRSERNAATREYEIQRRTGDKFQDAIQTMNDFWKNLIDEYSDKIPALGKPEPFEDTRPNPNAPSRVLNPEYPNDLHPPMEPSIIYPLPNGRPSIGPAG